MAQEATRLQQKILQYDRSTKKRYDEKQTPSQLWRLNFNIENMKI